MKSKTKMKNQGMRDGKAGREPIYHLVSDLDEDERELIEQYVFGYRLGVAERKGRL